MISHASKRMVQWTLAVVLVFSLVSAVSAQDVKKTGTSAAAFLRIPVGATGTAMGSAFAAVADDPSAMYWNPSGLASLTNYALMVDYSPWLPGLNFSYIGIALPLSGIGTVGVNVTSLATDEMMVTTVSQPEGTGSLFSANSFAVGLTYAKGLTDRFAIGATFKYIRETIYNSGADGFAFDIGTIYTTPFDGIRLGVSIANFGTAMRMDGEDLNVRIDIDPTQRGNNQSIVGRLRTDSFDAPLVMRVGLAWDAMERNGNVLTLAVDGINPNDNSQSVNVGARVSLLNNVLVLTGGYSDLLLDDREMGLTLGAGVNLKTQSGMGISAGYAFQDFENLRSVNRFTVSLSF